MTENLLSPKQSLTPVWLVQCMHMYFEVKNDTKPTQISSERLFVSFGQQDLPKDWNMNEWIMFETSSVPAVAQQTARVKSAAETTQFHQLRAL